MITKEMVKDELAEFYKNRPQKDGFAYVTGFLQRHGNGATTIAELDPRLYETVWRAAGGVEPSEDFYGVAGDVELPKPPTFSSSWSNPAVPAGLPAVPASTVRIKSALTLDLEARLKERVGKPRSKPGGRVNYGNPLQSGDDDAAREYPGDGEKMS